MGKAPLELGTRGDAAVTAVACHPVDEIAAVGYSDGMILAVRFADAREVLLRRPGKGALSALSWDYARPAPRLRRAIRRMRGDRHFGVNGGSVGARG
jgi:hypothetical protein